MRFIVVLSVLALLSAAGNAHADGYKMCEGPFTVSATGQVPDGTSTANPGSCKGGTNAGAACTADSVCPSGTCSRVINTRWYSAPIAAWADVRAGTATIEVRGYGPCETNDPAGSCPRGGGTVLGTLNASTLMVRADGPVEAVDFNVTACAGCDFRITVCGVGNGIP